MLSEIVLGLLESAERLCLRVVRIVFGTEGLCVRTVRGLVFTPVRSALEQLLPLPPVSAPQPFAVAEGAMAPPEAAPQSAVPLAPRPPPALTLTLTLTLALTLTLTLTLTRALAETGPAHLVERALAHHALVLVHVDRAQPLT